MSADLKARARIVASLILLSLGAWILHSYLALLAWAIVLAITTWPIYQRLLLHKETDKITWGAVGLTLLIGTLILAPIIYGLLRLLEEAQSLGKILIAAQQTGIPAPAWLEKIPILGEWLHKWWLASLSTPEAANEAFNWLNLGKVATYTKDFAGQLLQRFFSFLTVLLVLLFVYQHGNGLAQHTLAVSRSLFGPIGPRYVKHATVAVRATVNGMMVVGIAKGLLMGMGYYIAGLGHPALWGAVTGFFAMIPFAAKLIFGACSLVLVAQGQAVAGAGLFIYGMILTLLADNYVRPLLIGNASKLPFIWALLGIFGGMETLGLLGLFLGPSLLAVLMSIWRDYLADITEKTEFTGEGEFK